MRSGDYPYPADEFDAAARAGGPRGVHRAPRSWWSRWWPFVVVLLVFPAIAYAAITVLSDWDGLPGADDPPAVAPEDPVDEETPTPEDSPEPEPEETPEAEETPEPPPEPEMDRAVQVFNATGIAGLAGGAGTRLEDAGFTEVSTGNWGEDVPATSTVYYPEEGDVGTAELIAETLGITAVEQSAERAPDGIVVVLTGDYAP